MTPRSRPQAAGGFHVYPVAMAEITVVANVPCLGLERGQTVTVEDTPMVRGALNNGYLTEILTGDGTETEDEPTLISGEGLSGLPEPLTVKPKRSRG